MVKTVTLDDLQNLRPRPGHKLAVRGAKQIIKENGESYRFYRNMMGVSVLFHCVMLAFVYTLCWMIAGVTMITFLLLLGAFLFLLMMVRPTYEANGDLIDPGCDMSMPGGSAEYLKDLIILCSGTIWLGAISDYFWMLLLMIPIRLSYTLWSSLISPWLFPDTPEQEEQVDDKKQRKLERRAKRMEKMR